jgi:hypothetical protein
MRERITRKGFTGIILFFILIPLFSFAQEKDTVLKNTRLKGAYDAKANILIVPFKPDMYVATGDQYICQQSRMTPGQLSDMIRRSLTSTLMYNMSDLYNVVEPPDELNKKGSDISVLYEITSFHSIYRKLKSYYKGYPPLSLWKMIAASYVRWGTDCVNDYPQKPNVLHHRYAKAEIKKDTVSYSGICQKYNAHFTLYITQFEMVTRFRNCVDLQNHVFQRDIFIHYTLLDADANFIDGGVVGTTYQSSSNDAVKILDKNLGMLTGLIIEEIRKKI